jgi:hypothetical protein
MAQHNVRFMHWSVGSNEKSAVAINQGRIETVNE